MRQPRAAALAALLLPLAWAAALRAEQPRLARGEDGMIHIRALPSLLASEEVVRQLGTGLTTTFAFRVDLPSSGERAAGGARVEVRLELWDEVYQVTTLGIDGRPDRRLVPSLEELDAWWKGLSLPILDPRRLARAGGSARVHLEVVPFSRAEQDDTQRWFAAGAEPADPSEGFADSPDDREGSLEQVFSVLIATSIQRRAVISYRWTLDLPEAIE